jgi:integrase
LDIVNARVKLPRRKTGISRDLPLWPETVQALRVLPEKGELVFYTAKGKPGFG